MKVALFGATGTVGSRIQAEALDRGHLVTAVQHSAEAPEGVGDVRRADATDATAVAHAVDGHDAVISAIGGAHRGNPRLVADAAPALVEGLRQAGVRRMLIVGGAGSLEGKSGGRRVDEPDFPEVAKASSLAQCDALDFYRAEAGDLEWTFLSPADVLEPGERTRRYITGSDKLLYGADGESFISTEDYAIAMIDELERPAHVGRRFTVAWA